MNEFKMLSEILKDDHECGDFGTALDGYAEKAKALEVIIDSHKIDLDAANEHIKELCFKVNDSMKRTSRIQAQAVTDLIAECSYSGVVDGTATSIIDVDRAISYADRLKGEG